MTRACHTEPFAVAVIKVETLGFYFPFFQLAGIWGSGERKGEGSHFESDDSSCLFPAYEEW